MERKKVIQALGAISVGYLFKGKFIPDYNESFGCKSFCVEVNGIRSDALMKLEAEPNI